MNTDEFNKEMEAVHELPEAPASATAKVKTNEGFEWLVTTRTTSTSELLDRIAMLDKKFKGMGWENVSQGYGKKEKQVHPDAGKTLDEPCRDCGAPMKISQKGKPYCSAKCWIK